ncbi:AraC family transcriptional regulator [Paenibacillus sp. GCM10023248]|uniref:AraC family transcriptional regulator n=1 Tax=Bacillales TaxID=1385 RepID=UPI0023799508|nr:MULTISPECIES: AraC family transcriptional regulator [Bacillales]MDD9268614.1 AraC family transcriptional regulator [Paenibacillus sp. MAHUQ-63]MDR6879515.1 AraC-like DNA-binding protein [Bacillus sp. 3255]
MKEYHHEFAEYLFHTPSEFEKNGGLWIIRAGQNRAKSNYQVGPRVIECYSVHAVITGSVSLLHGNETVQLRKGDLFCLYPGIRYSYHLAQANDDQQLRMYWLAFQGNQAESFLTRIGFSKEKPYVNQRWMPEHSQTMNRIHNMLRVRAEYDEVILQLKLYQLFESLIGKKEEQTKSPANIDWLERCKQYMDTHYMEGIAVTNVAKIAGVHRSHLYQECIRLLGFSPMQYLIKLRMEKSIELLNDGEINITDIALSIGYPDVYSFSRAFSRYYGMSPKQYQSGERARSKHIR